MKIVWRSIKTIVILLVVAIVLVGGSIWLAYFSNFHDPVTNRLQRFYPGIVVGSGSISLADEQANLAVVNKIDPMADNNTALLQIIKNKESELLLGIMNISYDPARLTAEQQYLTTGKADEYQQLLNNYFSGNQELFTKFVVVPKLDDALLRIKYNSDFSINQDAYSKAQGLLARIKQGQKFEDVAKSDSDDKITGQIGGDLGFVSPSEILPELADSIAKATVGEIDPNIVVSRNGYEILDPVETMQINGQKVWHVKHILVATAGYDNWLNRELDQFSVKYIKKF